MARVLNETGIAVTKRISIGDEWHQIWRALDEATTSAELVLITGGLGPTADDITKPLLCEYFGGQLVINQQALDNVVGIFERINRDNPDNPRPLLERNKKQAEVPDVCEVLLNSSGTAPGMLFQKNGCTVISMPGVPHEMKRMMQEHVLPRLKQDANLGVVEHRTLLTAGQGESFVAERLVDFEANLPAFMKLAYLPSYGMVRLRLTAKGKESKTVVEALELQFDKLQQLMNDLLVTNRDEQLHEVVMRMLQEDGMKLALAESCTGGYMAHLITKIPGSSAVFQGSAVVYSNEAKQQLLGVPAELLQWHGAVSEEVAMAMAKGALGQYDADYAAAVSGIMGPGGGSEQKPVGTVCMAVAKKSGSVEARTFRFRFDRQRNIELTANYAFNLLRLFMLDKL